MSNFTDGAPRTPREWYELGFIIIPCTPDGVPMMKDWQKEIKGSGTDQLIKYGQGWENKVYGARLDNHVDGDIDCPVMQKFIGEVICGAKFGRKSNPISHLLFEGVTENKSFIVPVAFEKYFKNFPHGRRLLDIRHGRDHFTYVPGGS